MRGLLHFVTRFSGINLKEKIIRRTNMSQLHEWKEGWAQGRTRFHKTLVHESLLQFKDRFLLKMPSRVLVPLCGKSVDMKWLVDEGHEVVGVEGVAQAINEFFQEQKLEYKESDVPGLEGAKLYQTEDGKLQIYKCDFFLFSQDIAGKFDAIWDRASLVALDLCDRERYSNLLTSVLKPGGRILIEALFYDAAERSSKGAPHSLSEEDIRNLFGEKFIIEFLSDGDALEMHPHFRELGLTWIRQQIRIMTMK